MSISLESDIFQPAVLLAVFLGLGVIILIFFIKWIKQGQSGEGDEIDDKNDKVKNFPADASGKHRKKEQTGSVKGVSKKKLAERENRRTARANDKGFNHPWLLATLKGHGGRVLDMDFSPNGKYLVSCSDDPDPGGMSNFDRSEASPTSESSPSSSESTKENSSPTPSPTFTRGLTRRQRKNRKRETPASVQVKNDTKIEAKKSNEIERLPREERKMVEEVRGRTKRVVNQGLSPLKEFMGMIFSEDIFVKMLKDKYKLSKEDMARLGYPLRPEIQIRLKHCQNRTQDISYYHYGMYPVAVRRQHNWDVNAEEFIPKNESADSGNGSGGSSSSSSEEDSSGSEASEECSPSKKLLPGTIKMKDARVRVCSRCGTFFYTTSKQYLTLDPCTYHPGRVITLRDTCGPMQYSCCGGMHGSPGCDVAKVHVWAGPRELVVNSSYVETEAPKVKREDNNYGVYSLDCEMSYTVKGLEVVKVTLVDISGTPVYNEYVKPVNEVVDFNTRYSGVDEHHFIKHRTKSLAQVQRDIRKFVSSETVLIGHGLENDLKGLKLIHKTVVDTSFTFPHFKGLPFRRSLKNLAQTCLNQEIQTGMNGHDSFEDARACMELMLFRLRKDYPNCY
ncbi:uncharacterized protein [Euwallacea similis]|uniref:uncharacterized protein isoform X2 n=1 Tax=Euwallacea similis TaxID=1736056 RepID=UPI00344E4D8A